MEGWRRTHPRPTATKAGEQGGGRPRIGHEYTNVAGVDIRLSVMNSWMAGYKFAHDLSLPKLVSGEVTVHE